MLISFALIFIVSIILMKLLKKIKLPSVVAFILTGIILGPQFLNLINAEILVISPELRKIALLIIMLRAGLSLDIVGLRKSGLSAILMSFLPAFFEAIIITILAMIMLGFDLINGLLLAAVLSAASPAIIVPRMINLINKKFGDKHKVPQIIMAGASVEDVFVIILFTSVLEVSTIGSFDASILLSLPIKIILGIICGILSGMFISKFIKKFTSNIIYVTVIIISFCFIFTYLEDCSTGIIGFSGLLATISLGATILYFDPEFTNRISQETKKLWYIFEILLFVLVGSIVNVVYAIDYLLLAIIIIFFGLIFRMLGVYFSLFKSNFTKNEKIFSMLSYTPKATVQAAIGGMAFQNGLESGQVILSIAVVSIIICAPLGAILIDRTSKKLLNPE
ncbi:MAG: cation:proton antiporter [Mycoplasmatales bacterium]